MTLKEMWYETAAAVDYGGRQSGIGNFNLRWTPTSRAINFERMSQNLFPQLVNHFEGHAEISTKNKLLRNITQYYDDNQDYVFKNMLPLTFCLKIPLT